jgi:thiol:disulfide interchange protein DsbD
MALLFSFLGGLILNLMPCVLPVLSLKVLSLVNEAGDRSRAWRHGLAFTAGVLVLFWALSGSLLALRAAGHQAGWGFQLQSPGFVVFLVFLFFAIGLNLFGVFEVGTALTTAGGLADRKTGLAASFWGGALATIVATPCTAPFMGSALGFALGQPAWVAILVFTMLGLGMATPYMLLTQFPALMRFVPKPGAWMESFKQFMGFLIMGTVVFLLWLFGRQVGVNGMGLLLAGLVVAGIGAWVYGKGSAPGATPRARLVAVAAAVALTVLGVLIGLTPVQAAPDVAQSSAGNSVPGIEWERYSTARVEELRASRTPVFIDFTADWCLTCQVNERVAFTAEVKERFESADVVMLKGDWTLRDDEITRALASYGRQGVPVYVLYGPDGQHRLLPELLSPGIVLSALDETL